MQIWVINVKLSRANKCSVKIFLTLIYTLMKKKVNCVKTFKKEVQLNC